MKANKMITAKLERGKTNHNPMGAKTDKCFYDGVNDCKPKIVYGHFYAEVDLCLPIPGSLMEGKGRYPYEFLFDTA